MANIRDLRQRITSVGNIQKITRAMEMVATTKLRRFQDKAVAAKPYTAGLRSLIERLTPAVGNNPEAAGEAAELFAENGADAPHGVLFVGSDRGLCGAYNTNIQRVLDTHLESLGKPARLYVVGRKAMAHAARAGHDVAMYFEDRPLEKQTFADAAFISNAMVNDFRNGVVSGVSLCYTRFVSMMRYDPRFDSFLPIRPPESDGGAGESQDTIFEPSGPDLVSRLVPRYLETTVYHALLEAITSEYASRRFAMTNATEAAGEMKNEITREYNKVRQAKITSEILEVVSGAEAL